MADLQFPLSHDHALDQQLKDRLLLRQRRPVQPRSDPLAERRQVRQHRPGVRRLLAYPRLLLALLSQGLPTLDDSPAAQAEFLQAEDLRLVGVDQPPLLALQPPELGLELPGLLPLVDRALGGEPRHLLELGQKSLGIPKQAFDMPPDRSLQGARLGHPLRAPPLAGAAGAVLATALVVATRGQV